MRSEDRLWLQTKLRALEKAAGDDAFELPMPDGSRVLVPSLVAGFAKVLAWRCAKLGAFDDVGHGPTPVVDAMFARKEPKAGPDGTMSWTVDVANPHTGDDLVLWLKELQMPDGRRRPYSVWLAGEYPRTLDGLCKALSLDMRVIDPAWIGMKLRKLLNYPEFNGEFMARVPGSKRSQTWPSTVAYLARLVVHRYAMLGILDEDGYPIVDTGIMAGKARGRDIEPAPVLPGKRCTECGNRSVIRRDGCEFCTACGAIGACG